ncbi:MAG: MBL fold metallo-hydrolase [bacterium]
MSQSLHQPLQVLPLGIGDAFSSIDYYTSMVVFGGQSLCQVDCPDPFRKILRERTGRTSRPLDAGDIDHVLLTHLHGDHCNGLEGFLFFRKFILQKPPTIHMIQEVAEALWNERLAMAMRRTNMPHLGIDEEYGPDDFYRTEIIDPDNSHDIGDLRFEIHRTIHPVPTFGFRVRVKDSGATGPCFSYSCDTVFDHEHLDFLAEADVIFHECGDSMIHTHYDKLLSLPDKIRSKIRLVHLADNFDRENCELPIVSPGEILTI